ncbi:hypothetical protein ACIBG8_49615 [Nonomuraea sp. NPDC050556]|uniref:hypothetical protein n=1 Tax=Nonomuraea sp. NPDC050556 TaxID=3364369 RepID=UPI00378EB758
MVQHNRYLDDTYLTEIETMVIASGPDWAAVRDNVFHPQGGGQPADRGWLAEQEVVPVRQGNLVVVPAVGLAEGDRVHAHVDSELRRLHAALHTAGHLVEAAGRSRGLEMTGSIHFPGQARIEFTPPEVLPEAEDLLEFTAKAIADDLPVTASYETEGLRVVRLGALHAAPCGGTHVGRLSDLAELAITAIKVKKGRLRITYTASHSPRR